MTRTKDQFDDCGFIKAIASNGMGVFDYTYTNAAKKKITEEYQIAMKCSIGDRVVNPVGSKRGFTIVKKEEWDAMPATETEAKTVAAEQNTPQLADITKRIDAVESTNASLKSENEALKAQIAELQAKKNNGGNQ